MSIKRNRMRHIVLVLGGVLAGTANAQQIEEIVVEVQRKETEIWNTPASIELLDQEEIQQLQPNGLADLVRYQPAISFDQSNDRRGNGTFVIRGLSGNRVIMLLDGTRLPDGFGSAGVSNGRNSFEPYSMGDIQFMKGPSSALYGSDALAGVVLLNTVSPDALLGGSDSPIFELGGGYDQVNEGFRQTATVAGPAGGGSYLLQASTRQFSETDIYGDYENFPLDGTQENLLFKWENSSNPDNQYGFLMDYWRRAVDASFNSALSPARNITNHYEEDESHRWRIGFQQELANVFNLDRLDWQIDFQEGVIAEDEFEHRLDGGVPILNREDVEVNQELVSASVLLGETWENHDLLAGIDIVRKSSERINFYRDIYLDTGEVDLSRNGVVYPLRPHPYSETDLLGIFVQDEIFLLEDRLRLNLGLRYDYYKNSPEPDALYFNSNPTGQRVGEVSSESFSPTLGVVYAVDDAVSLFGNYTSGFRTPPVSEQYINTFIQSRGFPHEVLANPDLTSEKSNGVEVGLRLRHAIGSLEIAAYRTDYEDFIESTRSGTRPNPIPGFRPVTQIRYLNLSDVEIDGTELDAEIYLHNLFETPHQWLLDFSFASLDGENRSTDEPLTSVGPRQGILGLTFRSANNDFGGRLNARFVDEFDNVRPGTLVVPSYTTVDLSAFYNFSPNFSAHLRINNLLDEQYWHQFVAGSRITGDIGDSAAPGRNVSVSIRYGFGI